LEHDEIRALLRERRLVQEPPLSMQFGVFKNGEQELETPALFVRYDLPLSAQPWDNMCDGDVLNFFFEEDSVNIARIEEGKIVLDLCVDSRLKNYAAFRAALTQHDQLNIVVMHPRGGCALVANQGISGRYRITYHETITEDGLGPLETLRKEIDGPKKTDDAPTDQGVRAGADGSQP